MSNRETPAARDPQPRRQEEALQEETRNLFRIDDGPAFLSLIPTLCMVLVGKVKALENVNMGEWIEQITAATTSTVSSDGSLTTREMASFVACWEWTRFFGTIDWNSFNITIST